MVTTQMWQILIVAVGTKFLSSSFPVSFACFIPRFIRNDDLVVPSLELFDECTQYMTLLSGPPASAKTMFLMSLRERLKDSYFIDGGNATKAGIIDYLFKNRAPYLLLDEIDKMCHRDQTFLLNLMETGIISETKYGKTREAEIKTSVFATCNDTRKLSAPLQSRFFVVHLESYTYEQFYDVTWLALIFDHNVDRIIADAVLKTSRNLRDCMRIGKLVQSKRI